MTLRHGLYDMLQFLCLYKSHRPFHVSTLLGEQEILSQPLLRLPCLSPRVESRSQGLRCPEHWGTRSTKPIMSFAVSQLPCFQAQPGYGGFGAAGETDTPSMWSFSTCFHLAGVTARAQRFASRYVGFRDDLGAIPSPEGGFQTFSL